MQDYRDPRAIGSYVAADGCCSFHYRRRYGSLLGNRVSGYVSNRIVGEKEIPAVLRWERAFGAGLCLKMRCEIGEWNNPNFI